MLERSDLVEETEQEVSETVTRLPGFQPSHFTGNYGVNYVRNVVENSWQSVFHPNDQGNELGIDGRIELLKKGKATGLLVDVQIRTGPSRARRVGNEIHVDVKREHIEYWKIYALPVILIWIDDNIPPPKAYWGVVPKDKDLGVSYITLLPQNRFGPHSFGEIAALTRQPPKDDPSWLECELLVGKLGAGIRQTAKSYYAEWRRQARDNPERGLNPELGRVEVSLRGWRHITRKSKEVARVAHSLALLPCARAIIESSQSVRRLRTLEPQEQDDNFTVARSLVCLQRQVKFPHRAPGKVWVILEETVKYATYAWALPLKQADLSRRYTFYSVFEKALDTLKNQP